MSDARSRRATVLLLDEPVEGDFDDDDVAPYDDERTRELVATVHGFRRCHPELRPEGPH